MIDGKFPPQPFQAFINNIIRAGIASPAVGEMHPDLGHEETNQQGSQGICELIRHLEGNIQANPKDNQGSQAGILPDFGIPFDQFIVRDCFHFLSTFL